VVEKYFENYAEPDENKTLVFTKNPNGWHAVIKDYNNKSGEMTVVTDELFWSRKKNEFQSINFPHKAMQASEKTINKYLELASGFYDFSIDPYYGYAGWDWDVIKEYGKVKNLSDTLLEALARAYSSYNCNLLNNNTGLSNPAKQYKLADGMNALSPGQLDTFLYYSRLCSETYAKLFFRNPKYETFIGGISYDYSNSFMNSFLNLCMYQNEEVAKKELKPGLYDPVSISFAENLLSSCAQGAILFTNGDNDTYPLLYVQHQLGFRPDIITINLSLLNTARYIDYIKTKAGDIFSFTHDQYKSGTREIVYFNEDKNIKSPVELKEIIDFVKSDDPSTKLSAAYGKADYFPSHHFKLSVDKNAVHANNVVSNGSTDSISDEMEWTIKDSYILKSNLMVLDMIANNHWKRPIYYAVTTGSDCYMGLENYMQMEGLAYRLVPVRKAGKPDNYETGFVNTGLMYNNMMNKFTWGNIKEKPDVYMDHCNLDMALNFRSNFARLAEALIAEGKKDSAVKVLDYCMDVMPEAVVPYNTVMVFIEGDYYEVGSIEKANILSERLLDIYEKKLMTLFAVQGKDTESMKKDKEQALAVINRISDNTAKFKQDALSKRAKKIFDDYFALYSK